MNIQLIQGEFGANDAMGLIEKMIHIKIKYHENKINSNSNEEDIKYRESKIKRLQNELLEVRKSLISKNNVVKIDATIQIEG